MSIYHFTDSNGSHRFWWVVLAIVRMLSSATLSLGVITASWRVVDSTISISAVSHSAINFTLQCIMCRQCDLCHVLPAV